MLISRKVVNKCLRLSYRASHKLFEGAESIQSGRVNALLNSVRRGSQPALPSDWIPTTLLTAEELAAALSHEFMTVTPRQVRNWTKRQLPVAHFALSNRNLLFDKAQVEMWMQYSPCRRPKPDADMAPAAATANTEPSQPTE